ncbi:hypothetical protein T440DRAFT_505056 [Plenodomus tracheiphilus IPT5]|uniref:C2H2-type domain-containing protein n=1 Tax=Plenodomus tracheiphilus IPT5 TaxID=1408161 RepID=A0A6A7BHC4_9PLEO|nr:hypothetical protein T440DRAFT_505056 [Plenodomus tracheiphilus IPT5]
MWQAESSSCPGVAAVAACPGAALFQGDGTDRRRGRAGESAAAVALVRDRCAASRRAWWVRLAVVVGMLPSPLCPSVRTLQPQPRSQLFVIGSTSLRRGPSNIPQPCDAASPRQSSCLLRPHLEQPRARFHVQCHCTCVLSACAPRLPTRGGIRPASACSLTPLAAKVVAFQLGRPIAAVPGTIATASPRSTLITSQLHCNCCRALRIPWSLAVWTSDGRSPWLDPHPQPSAPARPLVAQSRSWLFRVARCIWSAGSEDLRAIASPRPQIMAASTRAITPTHTGPFAPPNGPTTPGSTARHAHGGATFGTHLTKSPRGLSPRLSPAPLTGAAAMADERRYREQTARQTSPNPAVAALQSLTANSSQPISRLSDAPPTLPPMNAQADKATKPSLMIPEQTGVTGDAMHTSPVSLSSFGDGDATAAPGAPTIDVTAGPGGHTAQEGTPQQQPPQHHQQHHHQLIAPNPGDNPGNRAFTFPGPMPLEDPRAPARQMSLPGYGQNTPKSPSTKRHKCPYCSTDFTRHHNLKSHLLTHSQEKPYECPTCQARFRRLHDLKRHTKLHTGERPHTCFKCGRRFARGDALARHNKGQGGCAGRRSSFGMDGEEMGDGKGGEGMDGVVYTGEPDEEDELDDEGRRVSEPARKRQNTGNSAQGSYHQHSSTYPPIAANRASTLPSTSSRQYYPPTSSQGTNLSPKAAPSSISSIHNANQSNVFAHGGMTESPKPLSPGQQEHRRLGAPEANMHGSRSPSISQHMYGRARGTPPMALAPPTANGAPHLPSLPGLNPMASKQGSMGCKTNGPSLLQNQTMAAPGTSSQPGSMSSHGGSGSSMREVMGNQVDVWQYVRDIEARMARMEKEHNERISTLQNEITTLRAQLAQQHVNNTQAQQQGH